MLCKVYCVHFILLDVSELCNVFLIISVIIYDFMCSIFIILLFIVQESVDNTNPFF